jgi:hypothetical protein
MGRISAILSTSIVVMSPSAWTGCGVCAGDNEATATGKPPVYSYRLGDVVSARPVKLRRRYIVGKT